MKTCGSYWKTCKGKENMISILIESLIRLFSVYLVSLSRNLDFKGEL